MAGAFLPNGSGKEEDMMRVFLGRAEEQKEAWQALQDRLKLETSKDCPGLEEKWLLAFLDKHSMGHENWRIEP